MPRPLPRAPMRATLAWLATLTAVALLADLGACDKADNDWHQPGEPQQGEPDLTLSVAYQSATGDRVRIGEPVSYTVTLANGGDQAADGVVVALVLPPVVTLERALPDQGGWDPGAGLWSAGHIEAGTTHLLVLEATVDGAAVGEEIVVTATITAMEPADVHPDDNQASVRFSVINRPPRAGDDAYTLSEGASLSIPAPGLLANDLDDEGEAITLDPDPIAGPAHGALTILASGAFTYVHDGSEAPADSFLYAVTDASAERDTAMVRLSVEAANDAPVLSEVTGPTILEGGAFAPIALDPLVSDDDHADDQLQWSILGADDLVVAMSADRVLTVVTPDPDWHGADTLIFRVRDPAGAAASTDVLFTALSVNDPPVVAALPNQSVQVGGAFLPIPLDSYVADVDHDDADMQWTVSGEGVLLVTIDDHRVLSVQAPSEAWVGGVTLTVRATDPEGGWAQRSVRFEVTEGRR